MSVFGDFERPNADRPPMLDPTILDPSILDLVLKQGSAEQRAAFHQELGENPLLAMEVAETVALLEQFRLLTVEPSRQYESKLNQVVRQAAERLERRRPTPWWPRLLVVAAAAAITVSLLGWTDPLGVGAGRAPRQQLDAAAPLLHRDGTRMPVVASNGGLLAGDDRGFLANADALRKRLAVLDAPPAVRAEFEAALLPAADPLGRWLDPQNALAVLRSDHEHRSDSLVARAAASREFALRAAQDVRVQQLADSLAAELCERLAAPREGGAGSRALPETAAVALAVRACLGAGATSEGRHRALVLGSDWLAERADRMPCAEQVQALSALVEVAAAQGRHNDVVVRVGGRLLDGVLLANDDTWGRRLPELLGARVATATLADAGRLLAFLPGFGLSPERCTLVRRLLLGELRERCNRDKGPEALAGLVFGFADLLGEEEFEQCERQLRRWQPARLAPDFTTVHHIAWGLEPGSVGYTRLRGELRRLAVVAEPAALAARAALCLSLLDGGPALAIGQLRPVHFGD